MTGPSGQQYSAPRYYEIAFDMNRKQEVDFLVHCFRRYAKRPVATVLDIACGTGPHLIRLGRRGYRMSGLDLSQHSETAYSAGGGFGEFGAASGGMGEAVRAAEGKPRVAH